jgi:hypothetical protein
MIAALHHESACIFFGMLFFSVVMLIWAACYFCKLR